MFVSFSEKTNRRSPRFVPKPSYKEDSQDRENDTTPTQSPTSTKPLSKHGQMIEKKIAEGTIIEYRKKQRVKGIVYRACLTPAGKANYNEKAASRMRKSREKKKVERESTRLTRAEQEREARRKLDVRAYNRLKQREHRARKKCHDEVS